MGEKTKIETFDASWNPVTGCGHGCRYCYARSIATRFAGTKAYPDGFRPTLHEDLLDVPQKWRKPKRIFVCSMADLFGDWVSDEWIEKVLAACLKAPQHTYFFLTKNPERYVKLKEKGILFDLPNFWYGTSVTKQSDDFVWFDRFANWFLSIEPIQEPLGKYLADHKPGWVIIGAETGNRKGKVIPEKAWIDVLSEEFRDIPVFMKRSLLGVMGEENMRRELP